MYMYIYIYIYIYMYVYILWEEKDKSYVSQNYSFLTAVAGRQMTTETL